MNKKILLGIATIILLGGFPYNSASSASQSLGTNISGSDGTIYTITQENNTTVRRPYTSAGAFLSFGFNNWGNVLKATADDLALPVGSFIPPRDGSIICSDRGTDKGTCYLITESKRAGFTSAEIFSKLGFDFKTVLVGDVSFLNTSTNIDSDSQAHRPGTLVNKDGTVFFVSPTGLLGIPDWASLLSWGYSQQDIIPANTADRTTSVAGTLNAKQPGQISPSYTPVVTTTPAPVEPTENLTFTNSEMTDGNAGENYSFQFKASGGQAPYKFTLIQTTTSHPCCNMTLDKTTGVFKNKDSNTKPLEGTWDVWVKVTDNTGISNQQAFIWEVSEDTSPYFVANFTSQTPTFSNGVKLTITTKLSDGTTISNKTVKINGSSYTSNGAGIIYYYTTYGQTVTITDGVYTYVTTASPPCSGLCA